MKQNHTAGPQVEIQKNPVQRIICPRQNAARQSIAVGKGKGRGKNSNPPKKIKPAPKTLADKVLNSRHLLDQVPEYVQPYSLDRLRVLMDLAVGIQRNSLDQILRNTGYNVARAMLAVVEGLVEREPELAKLMFQRRQFRYREYCAISRGPRNIYIQINPMGTTVKISLMKVWRPFRRRQLVDPTLVRAVDALDDFLDAIGIDTPPNVEDPEEPEADDTAANIFTTSADMDDGGFKCS